MSDEPSSSQPLLPQDSHPPRISHHTRYRYVQEKVQNFLTSKYQHYCVLGLVTLDIFSIFADVFINLGTCERKLAGEGWENTRDGLSIAGLVFSCLFMVELLLSIWAFGWRFVFFFSLSHISTKNISSQVNQNAQPPPTYPSLDISRLGSTSSTAL